MNCKNYADLDQSRKLAQILPLESADMAYWKKSYRPNDYAIMARHTKELQEGFEAKGMEYIPCWSLAALLKYLSDIKPQVYTPVLFQSEGKWILQFAEYGHGNVCEMSCDNHIDACVDMIEKLDELKML